MDSLRAHRRKRHKRTINSSRLTRQNLLSSWLERRMHEEIQEVHSIMNLLENYRSDATMEDSDGSCTPRSIIRVMESLTEGTEGSLPHGTRSADCVTQPQYSMYSAGIPTFSDPHVRESSSDGLDARLDLLLHGTSNSVYEPAAKPFQRIYFEPGNALLSSAARPDAELFVPVGQVNQAKVKCTWDKCSALINKDNLTRHVTEVHEGRIKAVCPGCGKEFKCPYQMNKHRPLRTDVECPRL
ncbi:uncharacterized protein F5147DRAFT_763881 [Suillus discolor]|uniref:C2H2-type domain-containing protein n=1 Tax=Suillus discolor TaxID=1912936 RepID=A0A9P7EWD7_9AGAM|nr:uncharacterized protein F5147DRAFT_763881 [Suillus discolor]KAG2094450.1 hypothetical protein F5147DRAFT_763881 [Suillus discolor]